MDLLEWVEKLINALMASGSAWAFLLNSYWKNILAKNVVIQSSASLRLLMNVIMQLFFFPSYRKELAVVNYVKFLISSKYYIDTIYYQKCFVNMQCQSRMHIKGNRCDTFPSVLSQRTDVVCGILLKVTEEEVKILAWIIDIINDIFHPWIYVVTVHSSLNQPIMTKAQRQNKKS